MGVKGILLNSEVRISAHSGFTVSFNIRGTVGIFFFCEIILQWCHKWFYIISNINGCFIRYFMVGTGIEYVMQILRFSDNSSVDLGGKRFIGKLCTHLYVQIHSCFFLWINM